MIVRLQEIINLSCGLHFLGFLWQLFKTESPQNLTMYFYASLQSETSPAIFEFVNRPLHVQTFCSS